MIRPVVVASVLVLSFTACARAQTGEGPLGDPSVAAAPHVPAARASGATPLKKRVAKTGARAHGRKTAAKPAATAADATPVSPGADRQIPTSSADRPANAEANDPISFGMKWNGANDTAEKTRVQNYDGAAEGTGAEVGLKLHF